MTFPASLCYRADVPSEKEKGRERKKNQAAAYNVLSPFLIVLSYSKTWKYPRIFYGGACYKDHWKGQVLWSVIIICTNHFCSETWNMCFTLLIWTHKSECNYYMGNLSEEAFQNRFLCDICIQAPMISVQLQFDETITLNASGSF